MTGAKAQFDYSGNIVLVTGAGSGISKAVAMAFADAGATVLAVDRNADAVTALAETIREQGGLAQSFAANISSSAEVDTLMTHIIQQFGRVDCAFNGAGVGSPIGGTIVDYEDDHWDQVMNVNLRGMFLCLRAEIRQMQKQGGGNIINVASIGGERATPKAPAYIASKHGVIGLTRATAIDHATENIRINAICPGYIGGTAMMDSFIEKDPEARTALMNSSIPIGRLGQTNDVAETALWLCSGAASFVTGATIFVDGGLSAK